MNLVLLDLMDNLDRLEHKVKEELLAHQDNKDFLDLWDYPELLEQRVEEDCLDQKEIKEM